MEMHFHTITVLLIYSVITCYAEHVCRIPRNVRIMHASSTFSSRTRRSTVDSKLKFSVEYTTAFQKHALFDKVKTNIVLPSLTFWEKTLSVKRMPTGNILLERQCLESQVSYIRWPNGTVGMYCNKGCESVTRCFTEPIPNTYLNGCKQLNGSQPTVQGERGVGIPPNGYLVFVDASATDPCKADDLLAYALACQLESGTDRPVAGYVNMCPNQLSGSTGEIRATISTFIHEMAHALGFSSTSYAFLRDENGNPRTPRDPQTDLPALGQDSDFIFNASTSTIRTFQRTWVSAVSTTTRTVSAFVLPNLLNEARAHYNCPTLDGMDVENDGGSGTAIVHFEKRITEDELMSGSYSKETYISSLTLAYFKDTGWYDVNMSMADNWKFGKNWGCDFVLKSCYEYMQMKTAANKPLTPYCNKASGNDIKCLVYDEVYGYCDLKRLKDKVPPEYQYFTRLDGVADSDVAFYGGSSTLSDRCPIYRPCPNFTSTSFGGNLKTRIRRNDKLLILSVIILLQILDYLHF
ncbi:unnamed protein product [Trichobilharzia szidati]|nr:unnamed protein product [Trichobilharzia szidati]